MHDQPNVFLQPVDYSSFSKASAIGTRGVLEDRRALKTRVVCRSRILIRIVDTIESGVMGILCRELARGRA